VDWTSTIDGSVTTYTVWIPVRVDAVIDTSALSVGFAGMTGSISGQFVGIADLGSNSAINTAALAYLQSHGAGSTAQEVQTHFHNFDTSNGAADVKFLQFDLSYEGNSVPDLTWYVKGLDPMYVAAPQSTSTTADIAWSHLEVVQDVTVHAGDTTAVADVALGAQAHFDASLIQTTINAVAVAEDRSWAPSFSVLPGDDSGVNLQTGLRTITVTVTRGDGDPSHDSLLPQDVVHYDFSIPGLSADKLTSQSAALHGGVAFEAGSNTTTLTLSSKRWKCPCLTPRDRRWLTTTSFMWSWKQRRLIATT